MSISITQDKAEERKHVLPSKDELLNSIRPDMRLTKDFFRRVYGYEISYPGFAEEAISALEAAGCTRAREHYEIWVGEYESKHDAQMKEVSVWYVQESKRQWENRKKEGEAVRARQQQKQRQQGNQERWEGISKTLGFQSMIKAK